MFSVRPSVIYQQGGILVYQNDDNYIKLDWEYNGTSTRIQRIVEVAAATTTSSVAANSIVPSTGANANTVWFRIVKSGAGYRSFYSVDGTAFTELGTVTTPNLINPRVGLYSDNGSGTTTNLKVAFDYFRVTGTAEVANVAPTVTLAGDSAANEGQTKHYTFTTSDPAPDTFSLVSESCGANGTLSTAAFDGNTGTGSFDCTFPNGPASSDVSVQVADQYGMLSNISTLTVVIANVAPSVSNNLSSQSVQYTDRGQAVAVSATDVAADLPLTASTQWSLDGGAFQPGLPAWLTLTPEPCTVDDIWSACSWTLADTGPVPAQAGTFTVRTIVSDGLDSSYTDVTIIVVPEDAFIQYTGEAIAAINKTLALRATVWDSAASGYAGPNPESAPNATLGDITKMWIAFDLSDCISNAPVATRYAQVTDDGVLGDGIGTAGSTFTTGTEGSICVNVRLVAGPAGGVNPWYAAGDAQAVLTFYEPSGQFATGGGWIADPDGGKGNFGLTARYLKKGQVQGNLVYIYRGVYNGEAAVFRIKSNALNALAFGGTAYPIAARLQGKATIQINRASDGAQLFSQGNATFLATVVDSNTNPNTADTFALVIYDSKGVLFKSVPETLLQGGQVIAHP